MADVLQVERRGMRVTYEHEELAEQVEQSVRAVHRHSVTADSDRSFLLGFLSGGASTMAIVGVTAYFLKNHFGEIARPLAPNCVIYEVSVPKIKKKRFEEYVTSKFLKNDLQKSFENVEKKLRQILGEKYNKVNPGIVEALKKTKIASVELCDEETLQRAWKKFWQIQRKVASEAPKPAVSLGGKVKKVFGEKISESKMTAILQTFRDLGVGEAKDVAHLTEADVAQKFGRGLSVVEQRKLMEFVKGHERPLPPSDLRLASSEYPNTVITVFFDDPNKMICDYVITALDMESGEEFSVKSSSTFGALKDLKPGKRYVIYVQCVGNYVRSKKTFFGDVIRVFVYETCRKADAGLGVPEYPTKILRGVQSAPTIDSAYQSEQPRRSSILEDDVASVVTKSEIKLGEDAQTRKAQKRKGVQSGPDVKSKTARGGIAQPSHTQTQNEQLWGSAVHNMFNRVFPKMSESDMENLLSKSEKIGIQLPEDFQYLKDPDVANELRGTRKIVELKKLLEYVKEEKYKFWTFERPYKIRGPRSTRVRYTRVDRPLDLGQYIGGLRLCSSEEEGSKGKKS